MIPENVSFIQKQFDIDFSSITAFDQQILEFLETDGFLSDHQLLLFNEYWSACCKGLISNKNAYDFINLFLNAFYQELANAMCLSFEWFNASIGSGTSFIKEGVIDSAGIEKVWNDKYNAHVLSLGLFHISNKDYKQQQNLYQNHLYYLYQYCGVPEASIESFFEADFQRFYECLMDMAFAINDQDYPTMYLVANQFLNLNYDADTILNAADFDVALRKDETVYVKFVFYLFKHFKDIRRCTIAILQTHFEAVQSTKYVGLIEDGNITISSFSEVVALLEELVNGPGNMVGADTTKEIQSFLRKDYVHIEEKGGFIGLVKRQHSFFARQHKANKPPFPDQLKKGDLNDILERANTDLVDLAVLHRLKFILQHRHLLKGDQFMLFEKKIESILRSNNPNFFSDMFELYFYFLVKQNGVPIELLISQRENCNEKSTCDYKIGGAIAADCKCILSLNADMKKISEWCIKIGSQVKSTIGYQEVSFGGGIIGIRDQGFEFLKAFSNYKGTDTHNLNERALILSLIIQIYAEYRRHTATDQEQVKFIIIYYIPSNKITPQEAEVITPESTKRINEILALFTTKYITDGEFKQVKAAFETVCPYVFKFNNNIR